MFRLSRVASPRGTCLAFALLVVACLAFGAIAEANLSAPPALAASVPPAAIAGLAADATFRDC